MRGEDHVRPCATVGAEFALGRRGEDPSLVEGQKGVREVDWSPSSLHEPFVREALHGRDIAVESGADVVLVGVVEIGFIEIHTPGEAAEESGIGNGLAGRGGGWAIESEVELPPQGNEVEPFDLRRVGKVVVGIARRVGYELLQQRRAGS